MGVNPQKILLIRNSHPDFAALSQGASDYYATARNLRDSSGSYYYLDFSIPSWGTDDRKFLCDAAYVPPLSLLPQFSSVNRINIDDYLVAGKPAKIAAGVTVGSTRMLEAIARVIDAYGIQAVFVTPGIPIAVGGIDNATTAWQPTETYLSCAAAVWNLPAASRKNALAGGRVGGADNSGTYTPGTLSNPYPTPIRRKHSGIPFGTNPPVMCGRVGWGDVPQNFSQIGTPTTVGTVQYIVQNALQMEKRDNRDKPHLIGGSSYFGSFDTGNATIPQDGALWRNYLTANLLAWDYGIRSNLFYLPTGSASCQGTPLPGSVGQFYEETVQSLCPIGSTVIPCTPNVPGVRIDFMSALLSPGSIPPRKYVSTGLAYAPDGSGGFVVVGTGVDPPLQEPIPAGAIIRGEKYAYPLPIPSKDWFCMNYSNGSQTATDYEPGGLINQFNKFAPGGWAFKWQSSAYIMAMMCLKTGGSLAFSNYSEPQSIGLPEPVCILAGLLSGLSGTEALFRGRYGRNVSAWGDPLYAPYAATAAPSLEVFTTSLE